MTDPPGTLPAVADVLRAAGLLLEVRGTEDVSVSGIRQDSRDVRPGDLFLAWRGSELDAHGFLGAAKAAGASAAVVERWVPEVELPQLLVTDGRKAAAVVADRFAGSPWERLFLVGVTGTNGKTTTALLARHLLARQAPSAAIGTLGVVQADGGMRAGTGALTTPGPVQLSAWLRGLVDEGIQAVAMEASSHALEQSRLDGQRFDVAVFTNLTSDHLDYHGTPEAYRAAKERLLELLKPEGRPVLNGGDPAWSRLAGRYPGALVFGVRDGAPEAGEPEQSPEVDRLEATALSPGGDGTTFRIAYQGKSARVRLPLPGRFNVENALAAAGVAIVAGLPIDEIAETLSGAPQIPGRMEVVAREPFQVLVDFAHTPDALERVLSTLRPLVRGRLIVVFGAGGDRDRSKRPEMGRVVAQWSDLPVVTSDNPRHEDPAAILREIVAGMGSARPVAMPDRREAIRHALDQATPDDMVLVAGKGHESVQIVGDRRLPFDDRAVVRELLFEGAGS